jgi:two-component system phosphate regulon sensor histidine kinase PhoR
MLKIVEDLLLLSKLEYQPNAFKFEHFDFNVFIEEVFEQAKKLAQPKNISVKLYRSSAPVLIYADGLHLRRMFLNLLNNAVKFTQLGGDIAIKVRPEGKKLLVSVSDNGPGIKSEDLDKIFDRFFHIDRASSASESGTGLGLSIAKSIAKIHQGDIVVKSLLQKGSTFTVILPI